MSIKDFLNWRGEDRAERFYRVVCLFKSEGIETETQLATLKRFGCDAGQGHLLARPVEVENGARLSLVAVA